MSMILTGGAVGPNSIRFSRPAPAAVKGVALVNEAAFAEEITPVSEIAALEEFAPASEAPPVRETTPPAPSA